MGRNWRTYDNPLDTIEAIYNNCSIPVIINENANKKMVLTFIEDNKKISGLEIAKFLGDEVLVDTSVFTIDQIRQVEEFTRVTWNYDNDTPITKWVKSIEKEVAVVEKDIEEIEI